MDRSERAKLEDPGALARFLTLASAGALGGGTIGGIGGALKGASEVAQADLRPKGGALAKYLLQRSGKGSRLGMLIGAPLLAANFQYKPTAYRDDPENPFESWEK